MKGLTVNWAIELNKNSVTEFDLEVNQALENWASRASYNHNYYVVDETIIRFKNHNCNPENFEPEIEAGTRGILNVVYDNCYNNPNRHKFGDLAKWAAYKNSIIAKSIFIEPGTTVKEAFDLIQKEYSLIVEEITILRMKGYSEENNNTENDTFTEQISENDM